MSSEDELIKEPTVADAEREARERIAAKEAAKSKKKDTSTHKPAVAAAGKRNKKLVGAGVFALIVIVALIGFGSFAYKHLRSPKKDTEAAASGGAQPKTNSVRKNLGDDAQPYEEPAQQGEKKEENSVSASQQQSQITSNPPVKLNKALALTSDKPTSTSSQVMTRDAEKTAVGAPSESVNKAAQASSNASVQVQADKPAVARFISLNPDLFIPALTSVPCSMDGKFVSDVGGKFSCTIASDVYSASNNVKLLRKGMMAIGEYRTGAFNHGQGAVFIIINKIRTRSKPFFEIPLSDAQAGGDLGENGVTGWIDNHYVERFAGATMVGMIPDIMNAAAGTSGKTNRNTDYTENSREAFANMAKTTLDNSINIPPTLIKNQGEIINLVVGQDIDLSSIYELKVKQ
ncbi:VirB10/TraB/TrbI family type IV secretion system protein [Pantoea ananatis]|uniref:VirB10/TraB/TrbI family type IV secretion system protein n=1 Tax=Pantoea ananas TaxID=553 RepID=UPI001B3147DB|nr:VirB10/TraB/TrbI family type IV secretion system protein [Pantoea ananatis]